jgi:UDP-N-acetylmuramoyl-L-alanyl-D-glutamate--2,6-diaminopimelate ligase
MKPAMKTVADETGVALPELLRGLATVAIGRDLRVTGLGIDSRKLRAGDAFLALPGQKDHGWNHVAAAVRAGARVILADAATVASAPVQPGVPVVPVPDLGAVAGVIAARFFGDPSQQLQVVGVTGTNGKTSTAHYIAAAMQEFTGGHAGIIGTLGNGPVGRLGATELTTPDPVSLQAELAAQLAGGVRVIAMEVSSHALDLGRIAGVHFTTAVFTNLTRDHLDFHGDMAAYGAAKRRLFELPGLKQAVVNLDDDFGRELMRACSARMPVIGYQLIDKGLPRSAPADVLLGTLRDSAPGQLHLDVLGPWGGGPLSCALTGRFNAANVLAACATLQTLSVPFARTLELLAHACAVPGRMETFRAPGRPTVVVDYAHTPDAVEKALQALRGQCRGRLVCVFGCGGDRDPGKRPQMGAVAEAGADQTVITSDNPRSENPDAIITAILAGMRHPDRAVVEPDRAAAITLAVNSAGAEDIVLVAGKGHETWQETAGRRLPFSDRQLARTLIGGDA